VKRLVALAVLVLLVAPAAQAKGPTRVCGANGCVDIADEASTMGGAVRMSLAAGTQTLATIAPAPYFRIHGITDAEVWVPSRNVIRFVDAWAAPTASELALLQEKTVGLVPYQPPKHAVAWVNWERVRNGDGYLKLVTIGVPVAAAPAGTRWVDVRVFGGVSPWNDGSVRLAVSPSGYLLRDGAVFRIPNTLARRILARLAI
jgi:hypothetical protein